MAIDYKKDDDGVVELTLRREDKSTNLVDEIFFEALERCVTRIEGDESVTGVMVRSGHKLWMAGADIDQMFNSDDPAYYFESSLAFKGALRRLERCGVPVVAVLTGSALGGGMEVALACHYRVAVDDDRIQFGFPEVGLGLLPAGGGVTRTVRLIGLQPAVEWLTQNKKYDPLAAMAAGMVHEVVADEAEALATARTWIEANPKAKAPWDAAKHRIPGGGPDKPAMMEMLAVAPAYMRQETKGNYPAPQAILAAAVEGARVDFETASRIESRYFAKLASGQIAKNMINAFWFNLNEIKKGMARPEGIPPQPTKKVGVLGAGMMGHGIAYVTAYAGMEVVMTDATEERAAEGLAKIEGLLAKQVQRGKLTEEGAAEIGARVTATADYELLAGCDLVIEAVFEERKLKGKVTKLAEASMADDGVFASNTSTLPITGLATAFGRPEQFIGLHFFSPVYKMQLVEIIMGEKTDEQTLAKAIDYVLAIKKVPIVVNDSRGFYTSRVFGMGANEGLALLAEGQVPAAVEMAGIQAGMPVGPLTVLDEVSLSLVSHIRNQTKADAEAAGERHMDHPGMVVVEKMLAEGRPGRSEGAGFYEYDEGGKRLGLWSGLEETFMDGQEALPQGEMVDRILFVQAIETLRCMAEGVLRSEAEANIGSIFGWGFPPFHGGTMQFVRAYGKEAFVARAGALAEAYGERFRLGEEELKLL
ncbi:MAG TPA: 3-hydroxyacyl-CoA dehydrogenase NAD-binding domain-containing protein [Anaerolineae bacterium]|nr:3-hydroxyacyl-CoA dehydrogenase NAD-binding domain-containing protein [Anaerolineae bacterium]